MDLSELKRSKELLLAVLEPEGLSPRGTGRCPLHDDKTDSFSVFQARDGSWIWKCFAGCGAGTIVDAAMRKYDVRGPGEAIREIENRLGVKIGRDEDLVEPVIDQDRAERLVAAASQTLNEDFDVQERWARQKRGLNSLDTLNRYRVGFVQDASFAGWRNRLTGWVLPITSADGEVKAVKLHLEILPFPKASKCWWAPFGVQPPEKPRHGLQTLWPPPEDQPGDELFLLPGELKALAMISEAKVPATSITTGEGGTIPDHLVRRLAGRKMVFIAYDDDKTGLEWLGKMQPFLQSKGIPTIPFRFGPVQQDAPAIAAAPPAPQCQTKREHLLREIRSLDPQQPVWLKEDVPDQDLEALLQIHEANSRAVRSLSHGFGAFQCRFQKRADMVVRTRTLIHLAQEMAG